MKPRRDVQHNTNPDGPRSRPLAAARQHCRTSPFSSVPSRSGPGTALPRRARWGCRRPLPSAGRPPPARLSARPAPGRHKPARGCSCPGAPRPAARRPTGPRGSPSARAAFSRTTESSSESRLIRCGASACPGSGPGTRKRSLSCRNLRFQLDDEHVHHPLQGLAGVPAQGRGHCPGWPPPGRRWLACRRSCPAPTPRPPHQPARVLQRLDQGLDSGQVADQSQARRRFS